jgi:hypothetical protein
VAVKINNGLMPLGDILRQAIPRPVRPQFDAATKALKPLSRVQTRVLESCPDHQPDLCFQHSVLCQIGLPYRDPVDEVRLWKRKQGNAVLEIEAGRVPDPQRRADPRPKHLRPNTEARRVPNVLRQDEFQSHRAIPSSQSIPHARARMDIKISKGTEEIPRRPKRAGEIAAARLNRRNRRKKIVNGTSIALGPFHHLKRPTSAPITSATAISVPEMPSRCDCHFSKLSTRAASSSARLSTSAKRTANTSARI